MEKQTIDWETPVERSSGYRSSVTPVDWTLVPMDAVFEVGQTLTSNCDEYGGKYPRDNWVRSEWKEQLNGMMNHVVRLISGEGDESEHVNHIATRALMLLARYLKKDATSHDVGTSTSSQSETHGHSEVFDKTLNK